MEPDDDRIQPRVLGNAETGSSSQYIPSFQAVVRVSQARCRHRCATHRQRYRGSMNPSFTGKAIGGMAAAGAAKASTATIIVAGSECVDNPPVRWDILQSGGGGAVARGALGLGMPYAS